MFLCVEESATRIKKSGRILRRGKIAGALS